MDSFEPFYARESKVRNLESARQNQRFRLVEVDTRDLDGMRQLVRDVRPSVVVDLAARAGVRDSLTEPLLYIDINVRGLQNSLTAATEVGAAFVFTSSSSVYGARSAGPFAEDSPCRPISPYGATKVAGEALVFAHHALTGLPIRIARLFTVYGPRQRPDLAVYRFASCLLDERPIPLFDRGRSTRDYTFVGDVADALSRLVRANLDEVVVNVGSSRPYSNLELVQALESTFGRTAVLDLVPAQPGDAPATFADITRARELLGWAPATSLRDGLAAFRDWFLQGR